METMEDNTIFDFLFDELKVYTHDIDIDPFKQVRVVFKFRIQKL